MKFTFIILALAIVVRATHMIPGSRVVKPGLWGGHPSSHYAVGTHHLSYPSAYTHPAYMTAPHYMGPAYGKSSPSPFIVMGPPEYKPPKPDNQTAQEPAKLEDEPAKEPE